MSTTVIIPTKNEVIGVEKILPQVKKEWADERGFFSNVWDKKIFQKNNLNTNITEFNIVFSKKKGRTNGLLWTEIQKMARLMQRKN